MRLRDELKQLDRVLVEKTRLAEEDRAAEKEGYKKELGIIQSCPGRRRREKKKYTVRGRFCPTGRLAAAGLPGPTGSLRAGQNFRMTSM